jgi:hypothetical protein
MKILETSGKLKKTSQLAAANGVLAAINGGYDTVRQMQDVPTCEACVRRSRVFAYAPFLKTVPISVPPRSYHTYGGSVEDVTAVKINGVVKKEGPVDDLAKWDLTAESVEVRCIALLQKALEH